MRVALVTESFDNHSGLGRIAVALASGLLAAGNEVHAVCHWNAAHVPGMTYHYIPGTRCLPSLDKLIIRKKGANVLRSLDCDIIHSFGVSRGAEVVSAQSCHRAGIEVRRAAGLQSIERRNWGLFDRVVLQDEQELMCSDTTRKIIAVSALVKTQLVQWYGTDPAKITVVPNGIHPDRFSVGRNHEMRKSLRQQLGIRSDAALLLFVGNEFDRKGLQYALEVLARLAGVDVHLLVAGGGNPAPYVEMAVKMGVRSRVTFMGRVDFPERLFAAADVLVFPTLYEPFGMVVIEAMAAGVPVITARSCGAVEGLEHEKDLWMLDDPRNVGDLEKAITRILGDPILATHLREQGRENAKKFAWQKIIPRYLEVYREVLDE